MNSLQASEGVLYVMGGFPPSGLHAGGLWGAIEHSEFVDAPTDEPLGILEYGRQLQYRKDGVYQLTDGGEERLRDTPYVLSPWCEAHGITWDWFTDDWTFGAGVTVHKTMASPTIKTVVHGTDMSMDEFLDLFGSAPANTRLERKHIKHESWRAYESRWTPGTCPQETHSVHLTWFVTTHPLPLFAYEHIRQIVENGAAPRHPEWHRPENYSAIRINRGEKAFHEAQPYAASRISR